MVVGRPLIRISETTSTNDVAAELARFGAASGTTVLAGYQTAGRGRAGRAWDVPPWTSLLLSFVWHTNREPSALGSLSLLVGEAVARTVETVSGRTSSIKWPNDVMVDGRKISGILLVNKSIIGQARPCVITGIGLNVNATAEHLPDTATSLAMLTGAPLDLNEVLAVHLANLTDAMIRFEGDDVASAWERLHDRLAFRGDLVTVQDGTRVIAGRVLGVAPDGALQLETADGKLVNIVAGDVTRGPRKLG